MKECPSCNSCFSDAVNRCPNDGEKTFLSINGEPILGERYKLEKRIGRGGMGVVYQARHIYLKNIFAVKVILPDLAGNDSNLIKRFRQEALAAAAIQHPNIVGVTDFGEVDNKTPFLVMQFIKGESLEELLKREKKLSLEHTFKILKGIASGLSEAHNHGVVHRDLKPLNIMIQENKALPEAVKILDFGLAKIKSNELLGSFIQAQTTGLMGSPHYLAPEQWADEEPDIRVDVYSLGIILFQMLTGELPFKGSSIPAIMMKHVSSPVPHFSEFGVHPSGNIESVVRHALEKKKEERTSSIYELVEEFELAISKTKQIEERQKVLSKDTKHNKVAESLAEHYQPLTTLRILTNPPKSKVFINNLLIGETEENGWLVVEGIQPGKYKLRIFNNGYEEWESEIDCNDEIYQLGAELKSKPVPKVLQIPDIPLPKQSDLIGLTTEIINPSDKEDINNLENEGMDKSVPLALVNEDEPNLTTNRNRQFAIRSYPEVKQENAEANTDFEDKGSPLKRGNSFHSQKYLEKKKEISYQQTLVTPIPNIEAVNQNKAKEEANLFADIYESDSKSSFLDFINENKIVLSVGFAFLLVILSSISIFVFVTDQPQPQVETDFQRKNELSQLVSDAVTHANLGKSLKDQGKKQDADREFVQAEMTYQKALLIDSSNINLHIGLASIYILRENWGGIL